MLEVWWELGRWLIANFLESVPVKEFLQSVDVKLYFFIVSPYFSWSTLYYTKLAQCIIAQREFTERCAPVKSAAHLVLPINEAWRVIVVAHNIAVPVEIFPHSYDLVTSKF